MQRRIHRPPLDAAGSGMRGAAGGRQRQRDTTYTYTYKTHTTTTTRKQFIRIRITSLLVVFVITKIRVSDCVSYVSVSTRIVYRQREETRITYQVSRSISMCSISVTTHYVFVKVTSYTVLINPYLMISRYKIRRSRIACRLRLRAW